jgi:hypothetical protein
MIQDTHSDEIVSNRKTAALRKPQRVLVACESSGVVREAFRALGHDAWSCDLLPADDGSPYHLQCDALSVLGWGWDLLICHPPCTYLTVSANKWLKDQPERSSGTLVGAARREAREESIAFALAFMNAPIDRIAMENPIGCLSSRYRKPDQVIQPWMFGHGETKATCLWLKNLPKLIPTNIVESREQRLHRLPPGPNRWKERSKTFPGIAQAMASQWG